SLDDALAGDLSDAVVAAVCDQERAATQGRHPRGKRELGVGGAFPVPVVTRDAGTGNGRDRPVARDPANAVFLLVGDEVAPTRYRRGLDRQEERRFPRRTVVASETLGAVAGDRMNAPRLGGGWKWCQQPEQRGQDCPEPPPPIKR